MAVGEAEGGAVGRAQRERPGAEGPLFTGAAASAALGGAGARSHCAGSPGEQRTLSLPCQSVPEVDPAATVPRSQAQQRTSASSFSSPPPPPFSAPQAPALSVTGPITANAEQVLAYTRHRQASSALIRPPRDRGGVSDTEERARPSPEDSQSGGDRCKDSQAVVMLRWEQCPGAEPRAEQCLEGSLGGVGAAAAEGLEAGEGPCQAPCGAGLVWGVGRGQRG